MTRTRTPHDPRQGGYSLIEVLVSVGVLAGVLLSISTMFVAGTHGVRSGRDLTAATTIGNSLMEDVLSWPFDQVAGMAGGTRFDSSQVWNTDLPNPAYDAEAADALLWGAIADEWRETVRSTLQEGVITYRVDGVHRLPDGGDDGLGAFNEAHYLRVTVTVAWTEARGRRRHVIFEQLVV
jgi:type II secretory pathway pseudopilin PulG